MSWMRDSLLAVCAKNTYAECSKLENWKRRCLKILCFLTSIYMVGLLWLLPLLSTDPVKMSYWKIKVIVAFVLLIIVYLALLMTSMRFKDFTIKRTGAAHVTIKHYQLLSFLAGTFITLAVLLIYLYAFFPGSMGPDNITQWQYVQTGQIEDWHPALHTMMIAVLAKIVNHYGFVVFMQMLFFSLSVGYLLKVMAFYRFPLWSIVLTEFFIIGNPHTARIMLYLLKDSAFTIFILLLAIYMIHIFMTNGQWILRKSNMAAFAISLICAGIVRHNGIFFTASLLFFLLISVKQRKQIIIVVMLTLFGTILIKYPIYNMAGVEKTSKQGFSEAVGLPMTIMANIKYQDAERLTDDVNELLDEAVTSEQWEGYELGNFNSVKWGEAGNVIEDVEPYDFMRMTFETVSNNKGYTIQAFYQVTKMVYEINGIMNWNGNDLMYIYDNPWGYQYCSNRQEMMWALTSFHDYIFGSCGKYLFCYIGIPMLLIIGVILISFSRNGFRGFYIAMPVLTYNLGTMLLLNGPDFRYFYFNFIVSVPLCLALLTDLKNKKELKS